MSKYYLLLILNAPLIGEVVRKYAIHSDLVFFAGDLLALMSLFALLMRGELRGRLPAMSYILAAMTATWIFAQQLVTSRDFGVLGVGARAMLMPFVYLWLSTSFMAKHRDAIRLLFISATFWVCLAGAMAMAQIALGRDHPINAVWGDQALGMGDYSGVGQETVAGDLFRPTSIFTHTGKFGQVAFLLVLFRWCVYAFSNAKQNKMSYVFILADILTVAISGQRAAFVFLLISAAAMAWFAGRVSGKALARALAGLTGVAALVAGFCLAFPQYGAALISRFESGVMEIPLRLQGNLVLPIGTILKDHLAFGEGFGYFTMGARQFGGKVIYQDLDLEGFGESSLIRICGEIGLIGAMLYIGMYLTIYWKATMATRAIAGTASLPSAIFYVLWITSLVLWCNTADVFGNTVATFMGYALSGAVLLTDGVVKGRGVGNAPFSNLLGATSSRADFSRDRSSRDTGQSIGSRVR